jgi:ribose/xylose/arabinose/galactoside ABC-type transport system permease subunit
MSVRMIDGASGLMCGVANHLMCGVAYHLMCSVAYHLMCGGVNGRTRVVTEILVAGPTLAPVMVATTRCRMANAGHTFGAKPSGLSRAARPETTQKQDREETMIRATLLFFLALLAGQGVCLRKKPWKREASRRSSNWRRLHSGTCSS